jgi:hypothetical protein
MAVGRISGPLLKDNLLRNGVNLAFETSLLYIDVINSRIGVNTTAPSNDLQVVGTTRTTNLQTTTQATIASFTVSGNTIASSNSTINLVPAGGTSGVVYQGNLTVGTQLNINGNTISTVGTNRDLNITTTGSGQVNINSNVLVNGSLHATGTITADGNIQLGDQPGDTITFTGEVNSDIVPYVTNTWNLGSSSLTWATVYSNNATINNVNATAITGTNYKTAGLDITGSTISTRTSNTNINLLTTGTGAVNLGNNLSFSAGTITNTVAGSITTFNNTGTGYAKINGVNGMVIPSGSVAARPANINAEVGMIRYNTEQFLVEVYTSGGWVSVAGSAGGVTAQSAADIGVQQALIYG